MLIIVETTVPIVVRAVIEAWRSLRIVTVVVEIVSTNGC